MPKPFFSDDPFVAALDDHGRGRKTSPALLFLLIPALGLVAMTAGMQARLGGSTAPVATDAGDGPSLCEGAAGQRASIEASRRNALYWRRANCCGAATPHGRRKMQIWERSHRQRLALFARRYPEQTCPK